ncbi:2OG-Fe(II) oxygenase [Lysobacter hankyongensis]|uniref:Prolyl 4-hydroxylase alpha subunit domain-containing protein n=1 Tax=Lysobacter hankyongensis TaxID=1176535 RepID=A0ABP9AH86_9GAMM
MNAAWSPGGGAIALLPGRASTCWLLPGFLDPAECDAEIAAAQACGFVRADADFPPSYRNNRRLVRDDAARADALYARLRERVALESLLHDAQGRRWRPTGINPRLRYCRYEPGEAFHLHQDGVRHEPHGQRSFLTFMIYLDDPAHFEGGATRFFAHGPQGDADGANPLLLSLRPPRGSLIVFDHALWHDGAEVLSGVKHVLRSDLMFASHDTGIDVADEIGTDIENDASGTTAFSPGHHGYVWKLARLRDGGVASAGRDAVVRLWSSQGTLRGTLAGHAQSVLAMAQTSADTLFTLSRDRTLRRWDLQRRVETGRTVAHGGAGLALAGDADECLISAGADGALRRWRDMAVVAQREAAHAGWIWDLALHGSVVVSAGEDGFARLWQRDALTPIAALPHASPLRALAIRGDSDGITLVCGDMQGYGHVWRSADGHDWQRHGVRHRHRAAIRALRWLPDGRLGSAGEDGRVVIDDPEGGGWHEATCHANFATDLLGFADGRLLSAGYDGHLRVGRWPN